MTYNYFCLPGMISHEKLILETPEFDRVMSIIESVFGLREGTIKTHSRERKYVLPRQIAMWINVRRYKRTLKETGSHFSMDHSTVIHSCQAIDRYIQTEPDTKAKLEAIINKLNWS